MASTAPSTAVAVAATASQVTPQSRLVVMRFMSRLDWRVREIKTGQYDTKPMTAEEACWPSGCRRPARSSPRKNKVIVHLHEALANIPRSCAR